MPRPQDDDALEESMKEIWQVIFCYRSGQRIRVLDSKLNVVGATVVDQVSK